MPSNRDFQDFTKKAILKRMMRVLQRIERMTNELQPQIDAMRTQVERNTTVTTSVIALIKSLGDQIEAAKDDPEEVQALVDQLRANTETLAAAVPVNTPSEGEPAPVGGAETAPAQPQTAEEATTTSGESAAPGEGGFAGDVPTDEAAAGASVPEVDDSDEEEDLDESEDDGDEDDA